MLKEKNLCEEPVSSRKVHHPAKHSHKIIKDYLALADIEVGGDQPWDIAVKNDAMYDKVLAEGSLGLGESYVEGLWDCPQIDQFIFKLLNASLESTLSTPLRAYWTYLKAYLGNLQSKVGAKKVIDIHYQLGNDLFQKMLDPLMVYSCGYWKKAATLAEAQIDKFDLICRKLQLQPGMKILDIGCGWGGFVKYAAENYGVTAVGVTLSENQAEYGRKISSHLPVDILLKDYRDIHGTFDRIISIGMFEHVGRKNYPAFMRTVKKCLQPDGLCLLHTIGCNASSTVGDPWIHKYIFPNGQLPSITQIGASLENLFVMEDWHNFGSHYDKTLMVWFNNFDNAWPELKDKYGIRFYRMWKYYLLACAGSFRARKIQLWQIVLSHRGGVYGYDSIR